jgi:hypothetical protein
MAVVAEGTLNEVDCVEAKWLHCRRPTLLVVFLLYVAAADLLLWMIHAPWWVLAALPPILIATGAMAVPWHAKRSFRLYKALSERFSIDARPEGLFFKRTNGESLLPWDHIVKWRSNRKVLIMYPTTNIYHVVPARLFADSQAFEAFAKMLEEHAGGAA